MSFNFCTSGAAIAKAGANANTVVTTDAGAGVFLDAWSDEVEGAINAETRRDWITDAATTNFKGALAEAASSEIANKIINYDMSGYTSRAEAITMINVNRDIARIAIGVIKDEENKEKMI